MPINLNNFYKNKQNTFKPKINNKDKKCKSIDDDFVLTSKYFKGVIKDNKANL